MLAMNRHIREVAQTTFTTTDAIRAAMLEAAPGGKTAGPSSDAILMQLSIQATLLLIDKLDQYHPISTSDKE